MLTFWGVRNLMKIDLKNISLIFGFWGSLLDDGFLERFLESEWSHCGGSES